MVVLWFLRLRCWLLRRGWWFISYLVAALRTGCLLFGFIWFTWFKFVVLMVFCVCSGLGSFLLVNSVGISIL